MSITKGQDRRQAKNRGHYAAQFAVTRRNKIRRLKRRVTRFPNDGSAKRRIIELMKEV